jgi:hypothetical protein
MINVPHIINVTPTYRARQDKPIDNERSISDLISCSAKYESAKKRARRRNKINIGSDHAYVETANSGIENEIAIVPKKAMKGREGKCLKVIKPPKYTIEPKRRAFTTFAIIKGSLPEIKPESARSAG